MKINLYNQNAEILGEIDLPDRIFGLKINPDLIHQVLVAQTANSRHPFAHTKDRGEVRGGGKKPWRQKGTGRARHGSTRSPIWVGGGVAFGPRKERNFSQKINKKTKRKALFMALSNKFFDGEGLVLDELKLEDIKTKMALGVIKKLSEKMKGYRPERKKADSVVFVTPKSDKNIIRATNNLPFVSVLSADSLNIKDLFEKKYLFLLKDAISVIEKTYKI